MTRAVKQLWQLIVVNPLTTGRLEPRRWAPAQQLLGVFVLALAAVNLILVICADQLRSTGAVVYDPNLNLSLPNSTIGWILVGLWLALTLLQTAALHGSWLLRLAALLIIALGMRQGYPATEGTPWVVLYVASVAILVILHILRAGCRYRNWEPLVVAVAMAGYLGAPLQGMAAAAPMGFDIRITFLANFLVLILVVATPPLAAAGAGLAQVAAQAGLAAAQVGGKVRFTSVVTAMVVAVTLGQTINSCWRLSELPNSLLAATLSWTALSLLLSGIAIGSYMWVANRRVDAPESVLEPFASASFAIITATAGLSLLPTLLETAADLVGTPGKPLASMAAMLRTSTAAIAMRTLAAMTAMALGYRLARRSGQWQLGAIAATIAIPGLLQLTASALGVRAGMPDQAISLWLTFTLILAQVWLLSTRRLTPVAAQALLGAALVLLCYDLRAVLAEPLTLLFGFSSLAALIFGLVWRLLTDGEFTRTESPGLPRSTRVLLYLANVAFATTVVAIGALSKDVRGWFNLSHFEDLGNRVYAPSLLIVVVFVALHQAVTAGPGPRPGRSPEPGLGSAPHIATARPPDESA